MKKIILKFDKNIPEDKFSSLFQAALNYGIYDIYVDEKYASKVAKINRVSIYSEDKELMPKYLVLKEPEETEIGESVENSGKLNFFVGVYYTLGEKKDEKKIIEIAEKYPDLSFVAVKATDWLVIPFENLIAALGKEDILLFAEVDSIKDAELLLKTLERGVDGIIFRPEDVNDIIALKKLTGTELKIELVPAEVVDVKPIPKADRVCVDTTSMLREGEGMLVGCTARGFVFVHAEVFETEFVRSRPFRVNAGDVSSYIITPSFTDSGKLRVGTNYLAELEAGSDVAVVDLYGNIRIVTVGRIKIETRPMLLIKSVLKIKRERLREIIGSVADADREAVLPGDGGSGDEIVEIPINCILQNAETVRVVDDKGKPVSVVDLKKGDKILVYPGPGATHFGTYIKETIIEK